jgi:hypothetical protein
VPGVAEGEEEQALPTNAATSKKQNVLMWVRAVFMSSSSKEGQT